MNSCKLNCSPGSQSNAMHCEVFRSLSAALERKLIHVSLLDAVGQIRAFYLSDLPSAKSSQSLIGCVHVNALAMKCAAKSREEKVCS